MTISNAPASSDAYDALQVAYEEIDEHLYTLAAEFARRRAVPGAKVVLDVADVEKARAVAVKALLKLIDGL